MHRPVPDLAEKAAKRRPGDKADANSRPQETHILGAFLGRGAVGDHRLDHAGIASGEASHDPRDEHGDDIAGKGEPCMRCRADSQRAEQHQPPAEMIRQPSENRIADEHGKGIGGQKKRHHAGRIATFDHRQRQHRDQRADADKIDPDNEQQHGHERYPALVRSGQASGRQPTVTPHRVIIDIARR